MVMGGFIVVGISAWGLLAGRWFQQFRPVRRLGQWLEVRSGGEDLERGWENGLTSRFPRKLITAEEPQVLGFSGVMVVCDQAPVAPPKPSPIELAPAAPRHIPQPQEKVVLGPSLEEIEALREGCRRIEDIRSRIQGRMVEMKVEIERIGGGGDRHRPLP